MDTQLGPVVKTEATTTAYAPYSEKEGRHDNSDGSTAALVLDLLLSSDVIDNGVLAFLDQLKVGRVAVPGNQLESDNNNAATVDFGRHDNGDDALVAPGC